MENLHALPIHNIAIDDGFWNRYTNLVPNVVLPYQWEILNDRVADAPASHCLHNFRLAAGEGVGVRQGVVFQDSDAYKWLEAVAYSLASHPDSRLLATADEVIALIGRAQCADGYLNTYYTLLEPQGRWSNLTEGHELYCAGHLAEAAVAYYEATGKRALLDIACRFIDLIGAVFGPGENQLHGYPGHPELELALVRLYGATGKRQYLDLSKHFLDVRGSSPNYFLQEIQRPDFRHLNEEFRQYDPAYSQSHRPVREQSTAEGHAVRAVYLYCAMADIALHYEDDALLAQCKALWQNIVNRRMFITGSIGSSGLLERFTADYDLPCDSNYSETCASIGLAMFGLRMARITRDAAYIDVVERALYNTVRAGIALSGDRYFYVNPLEVWPAVCLPNTSRAHVKPVRQKWFDVACCPTNIARTFTSLGQYIYSVGESGLFINLFIQNEAKLRLGGADVCIQTKTVYPKSGDVRLHIEASEAVEFSLYLRIPAFAKNAAVFVDGQALPLDVQKGYCKIHRVWRRETVELIFSIQPQLVFASPLVRANIGKVAIVRGPEVYCFEQVDNGENLASIYLSPEAELIEDWDDLLLGGTMRIHCRGSRLCAEDQSGASLMRTPGTHRPVELTAVPYGSWNNREAGEMIVWVHLAAN